MTRTQGNSVDIGEQVGTNYFFIDWSESVNSAANTSTITWNAYFHFQLSDAQLDDGDASIGGTLRWDNGGRVYNFVGNFTTRNLWLAGGTWDVGHNTDGTGTVTISGSVYGDISARSSASGTYNLTSINRSPTIPTITEGSGTARNAAGTTYTATATGGVNNSGPAVTWTLQSSTTTNFASTTDHGTTTTSGNSVSATGLNANTTYYFRIKATNAAGGTKYSTDTAPGYKTSYGIPSQPTSVVATPSTTAIDRIGLTWSAPTTYTGSGITSYTIVRSGTPANTFTGVAGTTYTDTDSTLVPGNAYTYTVSAVTSANGGSPSYSSAASTASASKTAPGLPYAPTAVPTISNLGLNITVVSAAVSGNGGVAINTANANEGYFVQYQIADTLAGTYGYGGTAGAWSPAVKMSTQATRTHVYSSMTPAKYYKFRTYAANTVIYSSNGTTQVYYPHNLITYTANFATNATGFFLAAGGKRWTGSGWTPTANAKRYNGSAWVPLTIARRFNGTSWTPLS